MKTLLKRISILTINLLTGGHTISVLILDMILAIETTYIDLSINISPPTLC